MQVTGRLIRPLYWLVRRAVPIVCVDVLPWRPAADGGIEYGLILRHGHEGGETWNLVGGRVYRGETMERAAIRHIHDTLGEDVGFEIAHPGATRERGWEAPDDLCEYFVLPPDPRRPFDPRQHSVGITYLGHLTGEARARNEAHDFRWYRADALPDPEEIGFGQWAVIERLCGLAEDGVGPSRQAAPGAG